MQPELRWMEVGAVVAMVEEVNNQRGQTFLNQNKVMGIVEVGSCSR